ncbi:MAG: siderophore-interacting protein [Litorilinea sp.]|nr:MAG: siderophore-interacting protein [Litorilinea sp.]
MTQETTVTSEQNGPEPRRTPPRLLQVLRANQVTPRMRRITLGGEQLDGFPADSPGRHIKLFIPRANQEKPRLPTWSPLGIQWPPREERPYVRTYTVRSYDPTAGELTVDFVLHEHQGPASAWAARAKAGDWIGVAGPGGRGSIPLDAGWYLFVGDESALPAISAYLERLPASARGYALVEVADSQEEQRLHYPAAVELIWFHRNGVPAGQSQVLLEAVAQLAWPSQSGLFVWIAGEAAMVTGLHSYLRTARAVPREAIRAIPFWRAGLSEEEYHDERHQVMDALGS